MTKLIDSTEMQRLHDLCATALRNYDPDTQFDHLVEEAGELIVALARQWRNRSTDEDILEEIVDVFMCSVEMGVHHYGADRFNEMLKRKNDKFATKVAEGAMIKSVAKPKTKAKPAPKPKARVKAKPKKKA